MSLILSVLTLLASPALAATYPVDCRVAKIYDGEVYEESLSTGEYPDVYVSRDGNNFSLSVGANRSFNTAEGDSVSLEENGDTVLVNAKYKDSDDLLHIEVSTSSAGRGGRWARLKVKPAGQAWTDVALLVCKINK